MNETKENDLNKDEISYLVSTAEFFKFLKDVCAANQSFRDEDGSTIFEYDTLAQNEFMKSLPPSEDSNPISDLEQERCSIGTRKQPQSTIHPIISSKIDEIINEGFLDTILPFICSLNQDIQNIDLHTCEDSLSTVQTTNQTIIHKDETLLKASHMQKASEDSIVEKKMENSLVQVKDKTQRKKSMSSTKTGLDREVVIHVCDEVKGFSKDFSCSQELLVSKMEYFKDITAGQRLDDIDISVHCDLLIFEWLMRWIKKDALGEEFWPSLDTLNVIPILVSASFLQMEPLLIDCLTYCHSNLNDIVKNSTNISCLNDSIVTRLAAMFTNSELDSVRDKKERVTSRLWSKMIQSLCEQDAQSLRGHYGSLCDMFRCLRCEKYLNESIAALVHCECSSIYINSYGKILSKHTRDHTWSLNILVSSLYKGLKTWRSVYWRLWGMCHYLFCATCESYFPVAQMNWCHYHPDLPQYFGPLIENRMAGPAGRFPCCGQKAFRFSTLTIPMGCQFREHSIQVFDDRDRAILKLARNSSDECGIFQDTPEIMKGLVVRTEWWKQINMVPLKLRPGLVPRINIEDNRRIFLRESSSLESSSETGSSGNYRLLKELSTTSSDGCESAPSSPKPNRSRYRSPRRNYKVEPSGRYWSDEMSARSNQDNQREYEERAMKRIESLIDKNLESIHSATYPMLNPGIFVRLEIERRERHRLQKARIKI